MIQLLPEYTIISYADDTAVVIKGKNWAKVETKLNSNLNIIANWLAFNKLSLNTDKTIYIEFGNTCNSIPKNFNINIKGKQIARVDSIEYIEVIFDSNMKWDEHILHIYNKTKYLMFTFYKLSKIMPTENIRMLYYALFHSIIAYGIIACGGGMVHMQTELEFCKIYKTEC